MRSAHGPRMSGVPTLKSSQRLLVAQKELFGQFFVRDRRQLGSAISKGAREFALASRLLAARRECSSSPENQRETPWTDKKCAFPYQCAGLILPRKCRC